MGVLECCIAVFNTGREICMDISGSSLSQPVNFYQKNTGNNINYSISGDNQLYTSNVFVQEQNVLKNGSSPVKKQRRRIKSKRLNTLDSDYLPDETEPISSVLTDCGENFFIEKKELNISVKIINSIRNFVIKIPLINYFFLKSKEKYIKKTVNTLYDISQNVDELMNTTVPFGEETELYDNIAKNLTKAANIIGETNKKSR